MPLHHATLLWKGQYKMEEQGRLQQPGYDIAPEDRPIKQVQLAGVLERVKDEGHQAKNVEVHRTGRRLAPQQHIKADTKVDQRYQSQPIVERLLGRDKNHHGVHRHRPAGDGISCLGPGSSPIELPHQPTRVFHLALVDRDQAIAFLNAALFTRTRSLDAIGCQLPIVLDPPDPVVGRLCFSIFLKVVPGENTGSRSEQDEQASGKAYLEVPVHWPWRQSRLQGRTTLLRLLHVRCHVCCSPALVNNYYPISSIIIEVRTIGKLRNLVGFCGKWYVAAQAQLSFKVGQYSQNLRRFAAELHHRALLVCSCLCPIPKTSFSLSASSSSKLTTDIP